MEIVPPLRVAAISFLNPAPLLYDFEHEPSAGRLASHYELHYTTPARCAAELHAGEADLGLIPVAELTPDLAVVPGCVIASLAEVRSILLLVNNPPGLGEAASLHRIATLAADSASRSSVAYVRVLLERFYGARPAITEHPADPLSMLAGRDAALLIGDHALLAREHRTAIDAVFARDAGAPPLWLDVAQLWRRHTGLPWVAAVWAVRPSALETANLRPSQLIDDLALSRNTGLAHVEQIVTEWTSRLPLSPETIRTYLTENISYHLDEPCLQAVRLFRSYAEELSVLPPLPTLRMLQR